VPFPDCFPVACVPKGGYPDLPAVQAFDAKYVQLVAQLQAAWGSGGALGPAIGTMTQLPAAAAAIVSQPLPDGSGNYGPDFVPANAAGVSTPPHAASTPTGGTAMAVSFATDIAPLFTSDDVEHMSGQGVSLDEYSYMSQPDNAQAVYDQVSSGSMPIDDNGNPVRTWSSEKVSLFQAWMKGGYQQ
jgi:hypothetical protein